MRLFKAKKLLEGPQVLARGGATASSTEATYDNATYNDIIVLAGSTTSQSAKFEPDLPSLVSEEVETHAGTDATTAPPVSSAFVSPDCNQHLTEPSMAPIPHASSTDNVVCSINNTSTPESPHVRNQGVEARLMRDHLRPRTPPPGSQLGHGQPNATIGRNGIGKW
uniref:Uncharacterized protein n=1 Tax=Anopheles maculatus TaxID=74869 RepID=A0A182T1Y0_9DIPT